MFSSFLLGSMDRVPVGDGGRQEGEARIFLLCKMIITENAFKWGAGAKQHYILGSMTCPSPIPCGSTWLLVQGSALPLLLLSILPAQLQINTPQIIFRAAFHIGTQSPINS
jgi:hypothetical protein